MGFGCQAAKHLLSASHMPDAVLNNVYINKSGRNLTLISASQASSSDYATVSPHARCLLFALLYLLSTFLHLTVNPRRWTGRDYVNEILCLWLLGGFAQWKALEELRGERSGARGLLLSLPLKSLPPRLPPVWLPGLPTGRPLQIPGTLPSCASPGQGVVSTPQLRAHSSTLPSAAFLKPYLQPYK